VELEFWDSNSNKRSIIDCRTNDRRKNTGVLSPIGGKKIVAQILTEGKWIMATLGLISIKTGNHTNQATIIHRIRWNIDPYRLNQGNSDKYSRIRETINLDIRLKRIRIPYTKREPKNVDYSSAICILK